MSVKVTNVSDATFHDYYAPGTMFRIRYESNPIESILFLLVVTKRTGMPACKVEHQLIALDTCNRWHNEAVSNDKVGISHSQLIAYLNSSDPIDADKVVLTVTKYVSLHDYYELLKSRIIGYGTQPESKVKFMDETFDHNRKEDH